MARQCSPSRVKRYQGIRKPKCGCWPCWAKFMLKHPDYDGT